MRITRLLVLSLVTALAAVPTASAAAADRSPVHDTAQARSATLETAGDSLHVFVVAQLNVSDSVTRDSAAVVGLVRHAAASVLVALSSERWRPLVS